MTEPLYRVGRKLGRTIYRNEKLIGIMDHELDAIYIVELLNAEIDRIKDSLDDLWSKVSNLS